MNLGGVLCLVQSAGVKGVTKQVEAALNVGGGLLSGGGEVVAMVHDGGYAELSMSC